MSWARRDKHHINDEIVPLAVSRNTADTCCPQRVLKASEPIRDPWIPRPESGRLRSENATGDLAEPEKGLRSQRYLRYAMAMAETIDKRVGELERKVADLSAVVLRLTPQRKDWRATVGMLREDELSREADRLGREYRQQQREP